MATEATGVTGLAGRYATALFELADELNVLDSVAADLTTLNRMIEESADLKRLIKSPVLSREAQAAGITGLVDAAGFGHITRNFLGLIARNRRLFTLPGIIAGYRKLLADRRGEVRATVTAAQPLSQAQIEAINTQLRQAVGSDVALEIWINPAIIGGLVLKVGSRMVDGSLQTKLQRLQLAMRGN